MDSLWNRYTREKVRRAGKGKKNMERTRTRERSGERIERQMKTR
jgi:hypothetical protein